MSFLLAPDKSAVLVQACCVVFGWMTTYLFFFMMLLMYRWPPMRFGYDDFLRAMWGTTIPLYFCSVAFSRIVVRLYPVSTAASPPKSPAKHEEHPNPFPQSLIQLTV